MFAHQFNRRPFFIGHRLVDHPLFQLPRLVALAQALPPDEVEYNAGDLPVNADYRQTPRNGLDVAETIRRIEHCGSWMVLKRVERDPAYKALLDRLLDEIQPHSEPLHPGMRDRQGFIFITSPGSVTPFHMDNEYNFLLQVRGDKTVHMWDPNDRLVLPEQTIEEFHGNFVHRNLEFRRGVHGHRLGAEADARARAALPGERPALDQERRRRVHLVQHHLRRPAGAAAQAGLHPEQPAAKAGRPAAALRRFARAAIA